MVAKQEMERCKEGREGEERKERELERRLVEEGRCREGVERRVVELEEEVGRERRGKEEVEARVAALEERNRYPACLLSNGDSSLPLITQADQ